MAAVIRRGLVEMGMFAKRYSPTFDPSTLFESCGIADLIATCFGGRNRKCAEEFARRRLDREKNAKNGEMSKSEGVDLQSIWKDIEENLLEGQKLQGILTLDEIYKCLEKDSDESGNSILRRFPLLERIYDISRRGASVTTLYDWIK